jgi:hypothetical protein
VTTAATRLLAAAAWLAMAATLALPAIRSDARMNSRSVNTANAVTADSPANYLRLYSQASDPAGLTGYAVKKNSSPSVPAATGASDTLAVALGAWKNENGTNLTRVFTLQALSPLPAGASPLTVTASLAADPASGRQPLSSVTFSDTSGANAAATATLTAGVKKQLNLRVATKGFPGNNTMLLPTLTLRVTYPGYSGTFLSYVVPVSVWDGNGAGP